MTAAAERIGPEPGPAGRQRPAQDPAPGRSTGRHPPVRRSSALMNPRSMAMLQRSAGNLDATRCVAIEDSHWGIESARGAGLRCVGVATSYSREELRGAEFVVDGLGQLTLSMLDRLCIQPRSESASDGFNAQESR